MRRASEVALRAEAQQWLTASGEMFKRVLEEEGWSSRALVNWGRAMCMRAELAEDVGESVTQSRVFGNLLGC